MPADSLDRWLETLLRITNPRSQHYVFLRKVLNEGRVESVVMAHFLAKDGLMGEREMRYIADRWHANA